MPRESERKLNQPNDVKFYMTVDPALKRRFRRACGAASMTQVTQHLWRIFINSEDADKYEIIQEAKDET